MAFSRKPPPLVRLLISETDDWLASVVAQLVHEMARTGVSIAAITPPTVREADLLETAAKQHFDAAVLLVNNVFYTPYDLRSRGDRLIGDALRLVGRFVTAFQKPTIALYGWPSDDGVFATRLIHAGATDAFRIPCPEEDIQQALKRCLPIW